MDNKAELKKYTIQRAPKETKDPDHNDDYISSSIGAFGKWQFVLIAIASLTRVTSIWNTLSIVFVAPATDYSCVEFTDNITFEVANNTCYENCVKYEFVRDVFEDTLVTEFGLICEDAWLASFTQTVMMFGVTCGVSFYGWFSDRFGRSKSTFVAGVNCLIFMFITPFCPTYWTVTASRFFIGLGSGGIFVLTAVYISEIIGAKYIDLVICGAFATVDGIGFPVLAAFAYYTSTWRSFIIMFSSVVVLFVALTFFLPETPRWLIAKNRVTDAVDLMTRAVKFNGRDSTNVTENVKRSTQQLNMKEAKDLHLTYLDLFRTRKLTTWTIASVIIWFATGFCYYGILQYISQIGSNLYVAFSVSGVFHIAAAPTTIILFRFCGRIPAGIGSFITLCFISLALIFLPVGSSTAVIIGGFGVLAATVMFAITYIHCIEMYPTPMRNMGLSFSSIGSKVGAMVAPFVVNMQNRWVASSIFAAASFLGALFFFLLPETKGKPLKDTVDDD